MPYFNFKFCGFRTHMNVIKIPWIQIDNNSTKKQTIKKIGNSKIIQIAMNKKYKKLNIYKIKIKINIK